MLTLIFHPIINKQIESSFFCIKLLLWVTFPPIITVRGTIALFGSCLIPEKKDVCLFLASGGQRVHVM